MRIDIVSPVPRSSTRGNGVTARRWAQIFEQLGHQVAITNSFDNLAPLNTECLIGIHATRSSAILHRFHDQAPDVPLVVCISGTDLHRDLAGSDRSSAYQRAAASLAIADRIVMLEPQGINQLRDARLRERVKSKSHIIYQSAVAIPNPPAPVKNVFEVSLIGHLRPVKDPFRTAIAARRLPKDSTIQIFHFGKALTDDMCERAIKMDRENPRYHWLGNRPHREVMPRLARSRVTVLSSKAEGAPSVISEAVVNNVPILAARIPATIGLLGDDYPGFFEVGDTRGLGELLSVCECEPAFLQQLLGHLKTIQQRFNPQAETAAWKELLVSLCG